VVPDPPEWLSAEAVAEWHRVVPEMQRLELLKQPDRAALAAYCEAWARFVHAQMQIKIDGLTVIGSQGQPVVAPAVRIAESASRELRAWCGEFGFTPSAEGNLSVGGGGDDEDDPFAGGSDT
jgi:P27 family predicted phage terminase small subunit